MILEDERLQLLNLPPTHDGSNLMSAGAGMVGILPFRLIHQRKHATQVSGLRLRRCLRLRSGWLRSGLKAYITLLFCMRRLRSGRKFSFLDQQISYWLEASKSLTYLAVLG